MDYTQEKFFALQAKLSAIDMKLSTILSTLECQNKILTLLAEEISKKE